MNRVMAVDWGERRVGVAMSDESRTIASPHSVIRRSPSMKRDLQRVVDTAVSHDVGLILVGIPLTMNGLEGIAARNVLEIVENLKAVTSLPVATWDERLSTAGAEKALIGGDVSRKKRKGLVDSVAAALFLQTYLDQRRNLEPE